MSGWTDLLSASAVQQGDFSCMSHPSCCRTMKAVEKFGATCISLGIAPDNTAKDPYTGEPSQDPDFNPYASVTPTILKDNLAGLYPGIHALCSSKFARNRMPILCQQAGGVKGSKGWLYVPNHLEQILQWEIPAAVLKVQCISDQHGCSIACTNT